MLDQHEDKDPVERTEELSRVELLRIARSLHVSDADVMTRAELRAAIDKARRPEPRARQQPVTWVSVARRLLASIVEQGLHLPDAAALIRGDTTLSSPPKAPPPVATVTLARIYAAQGHLARALGTLDEVLATDADHDMARELREQLRRQLEDEQNRTASDAPPASAATAEPSSPAPPPGAGAASFAASARASSDAERPSNGEASPPGNGEASPPSSGARAADAGSADPADAAPPSVDAPPSVNVPPRPEAAPAERAPRRPGLIIIEADAGRAYVYWELPWPERQPSSNPYWISVVAHTPAPFGCDREERRYPVTRESGALRLEGVPPSAIIRAKLSRDEAPSSPPLVVASAVRAASLESRFVPHLRVNPRALAQRALSQVDAAGPAYW